MMLTATYSIWKLSPTGSADFLGMLEADSQAEADAAAKLEYGPLVSEEAGERLDVCREASKGEMSEEELPF